MGYYKKRLPGAAGLSGGMSLSTFHFMHRDHDKAGKD